MKKIISICIVLTALATVIGFATDAVLEQIETQSIQTPMQQETREEDAQRGAQIDQRKQETDWENLSKFDQMCLALDATLENPVDYNNVLYNYEYLRQAYGLSQEQLDFLSDCIIKGYEAMDIMDICYFWLDTNEDISIIEEMYLQKGRAVGDFWIENAFNLCTGDKCGVLDEEAVDAYIEKGMTIEDIVLANKLCRKGALTIEQILDKRLEGISFAQISLEINGEMPQTYSAEESDALSVQLQEISLSAVACAEELAHLGEVSRAEVYQEVMDGVNVQDVLEEEKGEIRRNVRQEQTENNLYKPVSQEDEQAFLEREGHDEN